MALIVQATYQNGILKLAQPLPLKEHEKVEVVVRTTHEVEEAVNAARRSYGIIGWTGDAETVERLALEPEFGIEESP